MAYSETTIERNLMFNLDNEVNEYIKDIEARIELTKKTLQTNDLNKYTRKAYKKDLNNLKKALKTALKTKTRCEKLSIK